MLRSIAAVATGFVLIAVLSVGAGTALQSALPDAFDAAGRTDSVPILLLTFAYVGLFATFGCWLAARMAPDRPMRHALILGGLGLAFNVAGTVAMWETAPAWFHAISLATVMLWAWLGGRIREWELARRPAPGVVHPG